MFELKLLCTIIGIAIIFFIRRKVGDRLDAPQQPNAIEEIINGK